MSGIQFEDKNGARRMSSSSSASSPDSAVGGAIIEAARAILNRLKNTFAVSLPENHFSPEGSDQFDIRVIGSVNAGATEVLMSYTATESQTIRFIRYGVYTNILTAANVSFFPTKNGSRILRYHGDPNDDFKLNSSIGPDLTENSLCPCDVVLRAGEKLEWKVTNNGGVASNIGVRMRGYLVTENKNGSRGFGG